MDDLREFESWHEDLVAWERFQDELEMINGENISDNSHEFDNKERPLHLEIFTQPCAKHSKPMVEQSEEITVE